MRFSEILKNIQGDKSDRSIAISLGVTPSTVANWKNDVSEPGFSQLFALADALEVSIFEVIGVADEIKRLKKELSEQRDKQSKRDDIYFKMQEKLLAYEFIKESDIKFKQEKK